MVTWLQQLEWWCVRLVATDFLVALPVGQRLSVLYAFTCDYRFMMWGNSWMAAWALNSTGEFSNVYFVDALCFGNLHQAPQGGRGA